MDDLWVEDHAWSPAEVAAYFGTSNPMTGTIVVSTNLPTAAFTVAGPATFPGSGMLDVVLDALLGTYSVTFGAVSGYTTPSSPSQTLTAGGTITFIGTYAPVAATPPTAVLSTNILNMVGFGVVMRPP
jgi:hypothetical protein